MIIYIFFFNFVKDIKIDDYVILEFENMIFIFLFNYLGNCFVVF